MIALPPFRDVGPDGSEKSQIVDSGRPQVRSRAMDVTTDIGSKRLEPAYLLGCSGSIAAVGKPLFERFQAQRQTRYRLAYLIVQLA